MKLNIEIIFKNEIVDVFLNIINFKHKIKLIVLKNLLKLLNKVGWYRNRQKKAIFEDEVLSLFLNVEKLSAWCWERAQLIFDWKFRPQTSEFLEGTYGKFYASSIFANSILKTRDVDSKNSAWSLKWLVEVTHYRCTAACVGVFYAVRYCCFCRTPA